MSRWCVVLVLGMAFLNREARAAVVVISGVVIDDATKERQPNLKVTVCCTSRKGKGCVSPVETAKSGVFLLTLDLARIPDNVHVVCENDEWSAEPVMVSVPKESRHGIYSAVAQDMVVQRCSPASGATPSSKVARCVETIGSTARVKLAAGIAKVDEEFQSRVRSLLEGVQGWEHGKVQEALASLDKPIQGRDLPPLTSALSFTLPEPPREMVAAGIGFCEPQVKPGRSDVEPYQERGDRCEGAIVGNTSGAVELVSLTQGRFEFDPHHDGDGIDLQWMEIPETNVCISAKPARPGLGWLMNTWRPSKAKSYRWELGPARKAGLGPGTLGVLARECSKHTAGAYLPLKTTDMNPQAPYEAVFLASGKLKDAFVTVEDRQPDGSNRLVVPRSHAAFSKELRPAVTVRIPREDTGPGEYVVTLQVYGVTNQGDGSLSFRLRHD